jgi:phosphatidylserine/phosphatidylglycerophosphate/cardiolipin synthase-like enzyme
MDQRGKIMAKFLNTSATNYYLEEMIKGAADRLVLISPYLKLNDRVKELLEDKNRLKIDVRIVYGKSALQPAEISWLNELSFIRTSFCKNLHAKCYLNESGCIITSLNLYEFSQVNNNEMGVYISREDDSEMYRDTYDEAVPAPEDGDQTKITSSKLAVKLKLKTPDLIEVLILKGYVEAVDDNHALTKAGELAGGEAKTGRFGAYFIWPENFNPS